MTHPPSTPGSHPASDREALSALFDGELGGDAARFALKRLDHDQDWRSTCERWQRVGDVLRNRNAPLPASFQSRLRDAVHADARRADAHVAAARTRRNGVRWGGAALAASAAVVAVFLAGSPFGRDDAAGETQLADAPVPSASTPQFASQAPLAPAIDLDTATASVAVAAAASSQRRRDRAATDRIVSSVMAAHASPVTADAAPAPAARDTAADVAALDQAADDRPATSPFTGEAAQDARPWPRAVLPQYRDRGGALAADFATAPSFYPFVPATPAPGGDAADGAPADAATSQSPPAPSP